MRLLVVEDERKVADMVARGLQAEQLSVDVAYDGICEPKWMMPSR